MLIPRGISSGSIFRSLLAATALLALALPAGAQVAAGHGPYNEAADARKDLAAARQRARVAGRDVMVIFGANWCPDCIVLHRLLDTPENLAYVQRHFETVGVDLGRFDKNLDLAKELGVNLDRGIPAAAFLAPDGKPIGNTNAGELEASRNYHSATILRFLREVAEHHKIVRPE
jgi:thiol-disulfide isomerase/thioredoxin